MNKVLKAARRNARTLAGSAIAGSAVAAGGASAAVDTAAITSALTEAGTAAGLVGAAVLLVFVGIKTFKLIKGAL